jgi:drug/metabolite transporter (DMT)-like permease
MAAGRRDRIDGAGAAGLGGLAVLFATNQIAISFAIEGFEPAFAATIRSILAAALVGLWIVARGGRIAPPPGMGMLAFGLGAGFAAEFLCLFLALDRTTVPRATIMLYSMPVWFALIAHVALPAEKITPRRAAGLALAFAGMALALAGKPGSAVPGSLAGDLLAVAAALGWAGLTFLARRAGAGGMSAEVQLFWMLSGSIPFLGLAAIIAGEPLRDLGPGAMAALGYQSVVVAAAGFVMWFRLLARYPASSVAAFSLLTPILAVALGWAVLGDPVGPEVIGAGALVVVGLVFVNSTGAGRAGSRAGAVSGQAGTPDQ